MKSQSQLDWQTIRSRAAAFPEEAFHFVREALQHTAKAAGACGPARSGDPDAVEQRRHITGQELCHGMRELAIQRYGLLAQAVLNHWGIRRTEDFGLLVYAMIDRQELRASPEDSPADFIRVFEFDEAFPRTLHA